MIFFMQECENRIGYSFRNKELLRLCFTHSSYSHEHGERADNERLEFFGDSVLGFVTAEYLMKKYPSADEGKLTEYKQRLVSRKPLAEAVSACGLGEFILFGEGESRNGDDRHEAARENLFEAIVAGIYLDGGLEAAKKFIYARLFALHDEKEISPPKKGGAPSDPKSRLQEYVQKKKLGELTYREISRRGPAHEPVFVLAAELDGVKIGEGEGKSKAEASRLAAEKALVFLQKKRENSPENGKKKREKDGSGSIGKKPAPGPERKAAGQGTPAVRKRKKGERK